MFKKCGTEPRGSIQRKDRDRPSWIYAFVTTLLSQRHLIMKSRAYSAKDHSFFSLTNEQCQIKGTVALQLSILMLRYSKLLSYSLLFSFNLLEIFKTRVEGFCYILVTLFLLSFHLAMTTPGPLLLHRHFWKMQGNLLMHLLTTDWIRSVFIQLQHVSKFKV